MISQAAPEPERRIKTDYVEVLDTSLTFSYNCFHSCLGSFEGGFNSVSIRDENVLINPKFACDVYMEKNTDMFKVC